MANIKRHFIAGKMNKSVDERLVPNGEYIDALNVRLGSTEASEIGSVENSKGNTRLTTIEFGGTALSPNAKCIGVYEDGARETIYWFINDPSFTGGSITKLDLIVSLNVNDDILTYHVVSERDGTTSKTTLNFNPTYLITGIDMVEDQLFFTDDYNAPRVIDITKNYPEPSGGVDQFTAEDILVIKKPPINSPTVQTNSIPGNEDFLVDRFICFAYRYRYENNQYSATSQFSKPAFTPKFFNVSISSFLNEGMENSDNNAIVTVDTGGPLVKGFDLLFKESVGSIIKVIERYDKQTDGIPDNSTFTYNFSGNKIFTILPDSELLRLYDNVPRFAQAQTIMGNRLIYGNYVDGYDLKTLSGQSLNLGFTTSLISEEVSTSSLSSSLGIYAYLLDPSTPAGNFVQDSGFTVDLTDIILVQGAVISFEFSFSHDSFTSTVAPLPNQQQPVVDINFEYVLLQDFLTDGISTGAYKLVNSADFAEKLGTGLPLGTIKPVYDAVSPTSCEGFTLTDIVNCRVQNILTSTVPPTSYTKYVGGLGIASPTGLGDGIGDYITAGTTTTQNSFNIQLPAMRRVDSVIAPAVNIYEYFKATDINMRFRSTAQSLSLHSNRNYEIGIIYMDDFNRATTALVSSSNTIHTSCSSSIDKNHIKVDIPSSQLAPSFATRYKFCIKPDVKGYETIYSNFYVQDPSTSDTYVLLEGENTSKAEEGESLIVKRDALGVVNYCETISVLEKKAQPADFLDPPPQGSLGPIPLPSGTYIKIAGNNINVKLPEGALINPGQQQQYNNINFGETPQLAYTGLSGVETAPGVFTPPDIPERTRISLKFRFQRLGTGDGSNNCERRIYEFEQTFFSSADYDNIIEWFNGDNIGDLLNLGTAETGDGSAITNTYMPLTDITGPSLNSPSYGIPYDQFINYYRWYQAPAPSNEIRFIMQGPRACGYSENKRSSITCEWQVFRAETLLVFETEPSDALADVWYESSESYAIDQATGYHSGNVQPQTAVQSAIIDTDFGNCYSFGNGVESYKVRDSIKGKAFDLGERFFSTSAEDYKEADRFAALTYSGVFNTETNVNKLNEFNLGILNFKNLEESFGAIQILSGRETDILTLQEDKISYVQSGKNLLSDAAGGSAVTSVPEVLGTQIARVEEYGISQNPESFVQYGYDKFFTDAKRGAVIQLRGVGRGENLTVISELGMRSWFRDLFIGKIGTQKLGAFDPYMNEYVLSSNDTKLPVTEVILNCGVTRRLTVTSANPVSFTVNVGNSVGTCAIDYNIVSFSDAGSITIAEDYTGTSTNVAVTGAGIFNFTKDSVADDDVVITLTPASAPPGGKQVVVLDITVGCPQAQEITLVNVCVTTANDAGQVVNNEYQWTDAGPPVFISPLHSTKVIFDVGTPIIATPVITNYVTITAPQGGGIIPNNGDVLSVISNATAPNNFRFNSGTNQLMFLRTNTLYGNNLTDVTALMLAATPLPLTGATPVVTGTHTLAPLGTGKYMYIIYDYFT